MRNKILSVSYDLMLLRTRELILTHAGFEVTSVRDLPEALRACGSEQYSLAIIGHSIPRQERRGFITQLRKVCKAPVVGLTRPGESSLDGVDYRVDVSDGPGVLVEVVKKIVANGGASAEATSN